MGCILAVFKQLYQQFISRKQDSRWIRSDTKPLLPCVVEPKKRLNYGAIPKRIEQQVIEDILREDIPRRLPDVRPKLNMYEEMHRQIMLGNSLCLPPQPEELCAPPDGRRKGNVTKNKSEEPKKWPRLEDSSRGTCRPPPDCRRKGNRTKNKNKEPKKWPRLMDSSRGTCRPPPDGRRKGNVTKNESEESNSWPQLEDSLMSTCPPPPDFRREGSVAKNEDLKKWLEDCSRRRPMERATGSDVSSYDMVTTDEEGDYRAESFPSQDDIRHVMPGGRDHLEIQQLIAEYRQEMAEEEGHSNDDDDVQVAASPELERYNVVVHSFDSDAASWIKKWFTP